MLRHTRIAPAVAGQDAPAPREGYRRNADGRFESGVAVIAPLGERQERALRNVQSSPPQCAWSKSCSSPSLTATLESGRNSSD